MNAIAQSLSIGMAILCTACASTTAPTTAPVQSQPVLITPSTHSLNILTQAVSTALNGRPVLLSPDTLTKRPTLIIDPVFHTGPDGNPIMGRSMAKPDHFQLVKRIGIPVTHMGTTVTHVDRCVLVHAETGKEVVLDGVDCVVVESN